MQTAPQLLPTSNGSSFFLYWGWFVAAFVAPLYAAPTITAGTVTLSPQEQRLLQKEQQLLQENFAIEDIAQIQENEQRILDQTWRQMIAESFPKPGAAAITSAMPPHWIYRQPRVFKSNPLSTEPVTLKNPPTTLNPLGVAPKARSPKTPVADPSKNKNSDPAKKEDAPPPQAAPTAAETIAPFLDWLKENEGRATQIAQEAAKKYAKQPPKQKNGEIIEDPFLNIRFPYRGAESATNSAVIYSIPEK